MSMVHVNEPFIVYMKYANGDEDGTYEPDLLRLEKLIIPGVRGI